MTTPEQNITENNAGALCAFHALVSGRVQGVGFRWTCCDQARHLELRGWVRNLPDGDVEVIAEGGGEKLEALLQWLRRGPPGSWVESVRHEEISYSGKYQTFKIR
ncbi:MAG TPA: acylphosphatase [Treponema sp.]|nr:acylphosphatase [Treponema sp.]